MPHREIALKIEHFYNDEDIAFRISSKKEMLSILQNIADQGTGVSLFYGSGQSSVLTTLFGANEHGMWLDVGPFPPENKQLLLSEKITFVSLHQHVKVQFVAHNIETDLFENNEAFYLELPDYILRIQRRNFFRTAIPSNTHVRCIIPIQPEYPDDPPIMRAVSIVEISGGGVGLLCGEHEATLLPRRIFPDCQISIPDAGILAVTLEVRNGITFTTLNRDVRKRVGCRFVSLDNQMSILLQRYITRLQSESLVRL